MVVLSDVSAFEQRTLSISPSAIQWAHWGGRGVVAVGTAPVLSGWTLATP
jgi:hypothetical protein